MEYYMHDWTLTDIRLDWEESKVFINFGSTVTQSVLIVATGVVKLHVPHRNDWGPSISVNRASWPNLENLEDKGVKCLRIEMQTGDEIEVVASKFEMIFSE